MTRLLALIVLALLPLASRGEGYICAMDTAIGFAYTNGAWRRADFDPSRKFAVRPATEADKAFMSVSFAMPDAKWVVIQLEGRNPSAGCPEEFDAAGNPVCHGPVEEFRMNRDSLRFLTAYLSGFWDRIPGNESYDAPYIAVGICTSN